MRRAPTMRPMLQRIDDAVYRVERALCLTLLAAMTAAVFLDVVHRLASTEGPLERWVARFLAPAIAPRASLALALGVWLLLLYAALRTAKLRRGLSRGLAAGLAALGVAIGYAGVRLLLALAPNGLVWSQVFALAAMLWVGFLGASMATKARAHLTLEIVEFLWRGRAKAMVGRLGALAAAGFCAALAWLCLLHVRFHYEAWRESDGLASVLEGFPAPKFAVYLILPVSLTVMALRFAGQAAARHDEPAAPLAAKEPGG